MGLSFKPDVDDLRESPAEKIAIELSKKQFTTIACEPNIENHPVLNLMSIEDTLKNADIIVFLVPHKEFLNLEIQNKNVIDICGIYSQT